MTDLMLRLYDGYPHTSPQLRDTVRELQAMLHRYDRAVVIDGLFGRGTEGLVRSFQQARGLRCDGVVGPDTWQALLDPETPAPLDHLTTTYPLDHPILLTLVFAVGLIFRSRKRIAGMGVDSLTVIVLFSIFFAPNRGILPEAIRRRRQRETIRRTGVPMGLPEVPQ